MKKLMLFLVLMIGCCTIEAQINFGDYLHNGY